MFGIPLAELAPLLPAVAGGGVAVFKSIAFVQEGERGLLLRFGKVVRKHGEPKVIEPGLLLMIPFVDKLQRRHVRQQTLTFDAQLITIKNGLAYRVNAVVFFRVKDIYKALFDIDDLDGAIRNAAMGILRDIITSFPDQQSFSEMGKINERLLAEIKKHGDDWGVEFSEFRLTDCSPTDEAAAIVTAETGAIARAKAIHAAAEALGLEMDTIDQSLAAVLVGIPVAATLGSQGEQKPMSRQKKAETEVDEAQ